MLVFIHNKVYLVACILNSFDTDNAGNVAIVYSNTNEYITNLIKEYIVPGDIITHRKKNVSNNSTGGLVPLPKNKKNYPIFNENLINLI